MGSYNLSCKIKKMPQNITYGLFSSLWLCSRWKNCRKYLRLQTHWILRRMRNLNCKKRNGAKCFRKELSKPLKMEGKYSAQTDFDKQMFANLHRDRNPDERETRPVNFSMVGKEFLNLVMLTIPRNGSDRGRPVGTWHFPLACPRKTFHLPRWISLWTPYLLRMIWPLEKEVQYLFSPSNRLWA